MVSLPTRMNMLAVKKTIFTTTTTSQRMLGLGFPSRRHFSSGVLIPLLTEVQNLIATVDPSLVKIESSFENSSPRVGSGVFVRPWVIVTSAHVVGRVTGSNCEVGRTVATTRGGTVLRTRPLAVNFGGDVAVLHAVGDSDSMPPPSPLAYDVSGKELPLTVFTRHDSCQYVVGVRMKVGEYEDASPRTRTEWVYPVGDDFGWARYGGEPNEIIQIYPGSPWLSLLSEVVGIASWAVGKEPYASVGSFVVPPPRIRAALDYAAKGDQDRIVMDHWIEKVTTVADGCDDDIIGGKECVSPVPGDCILSIYK